MGSIWPVTFIVIVYLYFVLKIGPEFMKYRDPYNIDRIVLVYNAVQVLFSIYLVKEVSEQHLLTVLRNRTNKCSVYIQVIIPIFIVFQQ